MYILGTVLCLLLVMVNSDNRDWLAEHVFLLLNTLPLPTTSDWDFTINNKP